MAAAELHTGDWQLAGGGALEDYLNAPLPWEIADQQRAYGG